jgi:hypothetical protein
MELFLYRTKNGLLSAADKPTYEYIKKMRVGQPLAAKPYKCRNPEFNALAFKMAEAMTENAPEGYWCEGKTPYYVIKSCMRSHGFVELVYNTATGREEETPLSISFANMNNDEFQNVFVNAICAEASSIFGYEPEFIAKNYKLIFEECGKTKRGYCQLCFENAATERHHKFEQTKLNKELYGKLIHDEKNLLDVCKQCHDNNPMHISEEEFCEMMGIEVLSKGGNL